MTMLDTPEQILMFRLLQIKYALSIEVRTGLRHSRGSVLKAANDTLAKHGYPTHRTKARALEELNRLIEDKGRDL